MGETRRGSKPPLEKPPVRRRHRRSTTKKGEVKGCPRSERRDRERERERERGRGHTMAFLRQSHPAAA